MVAMPNVVGQGPTQVNAAFKAVGLYYTTHRVGTGTGQWTTVVSEVPAAGTKVKKFSTVSLNVR